MSIISGISFFESLTEAEKSDLSLFCQHRFLNAGEGLFKEGDEATALYIVKSGKLKAFKLRSEGEIILGLIEEGGLVGEMAFFDADGVPQRRMASVAAMDNSELIVIMNYSMTDLARKHKEIYDKILHIIELRKQVNTKAP